MTDCPNATVRDRLPDLLHGALDAPSRVAVEAHLAGCADCAGELALLRAARGALARAPEVDVGRIVAALPRPAASGPRLVQFPSVAERERREAQRRGSRWGTLAAAAVVALAVGLSSYVGRAPAPAAPAPVVAQVDPSAAGAAPADVASLLVVNTAGLSDADLAGLLDELDELEAVPAADPPSLVPVGELPASAGAGP